MLEILKYPFDNSLILRKRKSIYKELSLKEYTKKVKIAVLGGSTTNEIVNVIEVFLLNKGIQPQFYQSEYNKFYEDAVFGNEELHEFNPDIVYIHTTNVNILTYPSYGASVEDVNSLIDSELAKFKDIWSALEKFNCPIIQNNFDLPINRSLGNLDSYDIHGKTYFLTMLNIGFAKAAQQNNSLFINDINYLSASIGLDKWFDKNIWFTAKYAVSFYAIPSLANNFVNIIYQ